MGLNWFEICITWKWFIKVVESILWKLIKSIWCSLANDLCWLIASRWNRGGTQHKDSVSSWIERVKTTSTERNIWTVLETNRQMNHSMTVFGVFLVGWLFHSICFYFLNVFINVWQRYLFSNVFDKKHILVLFFENNQNLNWIYFPFCISHPSLHTSYTHKIPMQLCCTMLRLWHHSSWIYVIHLITFFKVDLLALCHEPLISFNTLRSRQNGHHFADDYFFKCVFLNENAWISISLRFVSNVPKDNNPTLV